MALEKHWKMWKSIQINVTSLRPQVGDSSDDCLSDCLVFYGGHGRKGWSGLAKNFTAADIITRDESPAQTCRPLVDG